MKYCKKISNSEITCKTCYPNARVHFKNTYEAARALKNMRLEAAITYMKDVLAHKRCIPYRIFNGSVGRTAQAKEFGVTQGRWPEKSCKILLGLLQSAKNNAEAKNLNIARLRMDCIHVNRARGGRRRTYRANGRIDPMLSNPCHIQMIFKEEAETVPMADKSRAIGMSRKKLQKMSLKTQK